jgi:hypothetical protein
LRVSDRSFLSDMVANARDRSGNINVVISFAFIAVAIGTFVRLVNRRKCTESTAEDGSNGHEAIPDAMSASSKEV